MKTILLFRPIFWITLILFQDPKPWFCFKQTHRHSLEMCALGALLIRNLEKSALEYFLMSTLLLLRELWGLLSFWDCYTLTGSYLMHSVILLMRSLFYMSMGLSQIYVKHVISAWSAIWRVQDQPSNQCMHSHAIPQPGMCLPQQWNTHTKPIHCSIVYNYKILETTQVHIHRIVVV